MKYKRKKPKRKEKFEDIWGYKKSFKIYLLEKKNVKISPKNL